jgi:protein-tyrosine phosphatase
VKLLVALSCSPACALWLRHRRFAHQTQLTEGARTKCERYFPSTPSSSPLVLPSPSKGRPAIEVHLHRTVRPHASYKRNELHVRYADAEPIAIDHLECLSWHDHGVPEDPDDLLALLDAIGDGANEPPTLVHCSAGVGRTGTLIATSALLGALPALRRAARVSDPLLLRPPEISQPGLPPLRGIDLRDPVALVVDHLRAQRCMMVQTKARLGYRSRGPR